MEVQRVLSCRIRSDLTISVLPCECPRYLLWCCKWEVFVERHVILSAVMVRLFRVPHTCAVNCLRSYGCGKHSSFSTLSTLITVSSFQRAQVRFSTKNGGTKPGLHRLPGPIALAKFASIQRLTVAVRPVPHGESHHPSESRKSDGNVTESNGLRCTTHATRNVEFFVAPVDRQSLLVPKCCPMALSVWDQ